MFVACGIWCLADVSSVSPSSEHSASIEQTKMMRMRSLSKNCEWFHSQTNRNCAKSGH